MVLIALVLQIIGFFASGGHITKLDFYDCIDLDTQKIFTRVFLDDQCPLDQWDIAFAYDALQTPNAAMARNDNGAVVLTASDHDFLGTTQDDYGEINFLASPSAVLFDRPLIVRSDQGQLFKSSLLLQTNTWVLFIWQPL